MPSPKTPSAGFLIDPARQSEIESFMTNLQFAANQQRDFPE
jgi:hypothetical protein